VSRLVAGRGVLRVRLAAVGGAVALAVTGLIPGSLGAAAAARTGPATQGFTIARSSFGVPTITATSQARMWFGAGWAQAQDRMVQLELTREAGQWTGSVAIDVAPAEGSGCPPLRKRYAIPGVNAVEGSVSFTDSGGNEWNLALRHGEGLLKGLMAWKTGDEALANGFKAPSGATPLTRLSGEVKLQRAVADNPAPAEGPARKVTAGQHVGQIGAVLIANAVAAGTLYGVNKAGKSTTGGAVTCSPRNCIITAPGEPCVCNPASIVSGASCGSTTSGVPLLGVCDGTTLPCQAGFSCNRGFCEDRSGVCPY